MTAQSKPDNVTSINPDPFENIDDLRLPQDFDTGATKKHLLDLAVRRPDRQWFFRVHPDPSMRINGAILELREEREIYYVMPAVAKQMPMDIKPVILVAAITRSGDLFLWPIRLPDFSGKVDSFNASALRAVELAEEKWIRLVANMATKSYDAFEHEDQTTSPEWPDLPFNKLLAIAFRDSLISDMDHPAVKQLRGKK